MFKNYSTCLAVIVSLFLGVFTMSDSVLAQDAQSYRVSAGDGLQIAVTDQPELSVTVEVIADGTISLPLLGAVKVDGMTVNEIRTQLEKLYNEHYIANPSVAVNLTKSRAAQFFIYGEVAKPGNYPLNGKATVLEAIVTAGGFTDYARKSGVRVLRKTAAGKNVIKVNVGKIERGHLDKDILLEPDDVIMVPERYI